MGEAERIAAELPERARLALLSDQWDEGKKWQDIVEFARKPTDRFAMSHRKVVVPLLRRGLVFLAQDSKYEPETGDYIPKLYEMTPLGLAVRAILEANQ